MNTENYRREFEISVQQQCEHLFSILKETVSKNNSNISEHNFPPSDRTLIYLAVDCAKDYTEFTKECKEKTVNLKCQQIYDINQPFKVEYDSDSQKLSVSSDGLGVGV